MRLSRKVATVPIETPTPAPRSELRLFIAEQSAHIRLRMVSLVARCPGVACVGWADSVLESITGVRRTRPHGLILDLHLSDGCGLEVLRAVRADDPALHIIVCATWPTEQHEAACRDAGAERVLDKATEFGELRNIVHEWARLLCGTSSIH